MDDRLMEQYVDRWVHKWLVGWLVGCGLHKGEAKSWVCVGGPGPQCLLFAETVL